MNNLLILVNCKHAALPTLDKQGIGDLISDDQYDPRISNTSQDEMDASNIQQYDIWNKFQEQVCVHSYLFSFGLEILGKTRIKMSLPI